LKLRLAWVVGPVVGDVVVVAGFAWVVALGAVACGELVEPACGEPVGAVEAVEPVEVVGAVDGAVCCA